MKISSNKIVKDIMDYIISIANQVSEKKGIGRLIIDYNEIERNLDSMYKKYNSDTANVESLDDEFWKFIINPGIKSLFSDNKFKGFGPISIKKVIESDLNKNKNPAIFIQKSIRKDKSPKESKLETIANTLLNF